MKFEIRFCFRKTALPLLLTLILSAATIAQVSGSARVSAPVNPHASAEARALLSYFYSISGQYTLTGQHNFPNHISRWTDRIYDLTGKYPALFGQDFGFSGGDDKDSIEGRPAMIAEVKRQYANGAVITLTWHAVRPTDDEPVTFRDSVQAHLTDFEWNELITPGTNLNNRWRAQVDVIAGYLKQLRDAHVPVLFRPYHEVNGNWFWWGGRPGEKGSSALYRQLFDRFVNYHHLDNLLWVWNVNSPGPTAGPFTDYFPGAQYVDMVTEDIYGEFTQSHYDDAMPIAAGKPIALGEVGAVPSLDVLRQQPNWTYFMIWSGLAEFANSIENLRTVFSAPNMITRDNPQFAAAMAAIRGAPSPSFEPVSAHVIPEARSLLGRLYAVSGHSVLSGQENPPQSVSSSTDYVFSITTKNPAIYGEDLGISKEAGVPVAVARQAIVEEAKRQHRNHASIALTWRATRPTDDEPGNSESIGGHLTEFEWNELLTPGTRLYQRWCEQVDGVATYLKQLQAAGIPVLWRPYPGANGGKFWWAGRKGDRGSAALYRQLFDRLTEHDGIHNLVWVWEALPAGFGPNGAGQYSDFFPGLGYVDALAVEVANMNPRRRADVFLAVIGAGKVIGLEIEGKVPDPAVFAQPSDVAWFLLNADAVNPQSGANPEAPDLLNLYRDSAVLSLGGDIRAPVPASPK